jgi:carboxyl-terminal processing protease
MRRSPRLRTVAFVLALPLVGGAFMLQSQSARDSVRLFSQVFDLVSTTFVDTVAAGDLYERAARGLLEQINDPYAALYSPKQLQDFTATTGGRYGGIGMLVEEQEGQTVVSRIFPNTPAAEAGVMEGDRIVSVDAVSTVGWRMDRVTERLKGVPGTQVQVAFARLNTPAPIEMRAWPKGISISLTPRSSTSMKDASRRDKSSPPTSRSRRGSSTNTNDWNGPARGLCSPGRCAK